MEWTILASAGTIGALFGTPVAAALIFSQTLNSSNEVPLWDRLFAPLMAAAAGALTTGLFSILIFTAHCALRTDGNDRYSQRCNCRGDCHRSRDGRRMVLTTVARDDASNENPVFVLGIGGFILGILGLLVDRFRCLKGWMRCSRWWQIRLSAPAITFAGGDKTCRHGRCCRQWLSRWANLPGSVCRRGIRVDAS